MIGLSFLERDIYVFIKVTLYYVICEWKRIYAEFLMLVYICLRSNYQEGEDLSHDQDMSSSCLICVPNVASVSGLSILDCPFGFLYRLYPTT